MSQGYSGFGLALPIIPGYGGTGVNNGSSTITLGGSLTTSGAYASTFTMTNTTTVTFPTTGTLATVNGNLGAFTATSVTFSPTTGGIVGTTTNDSASAGYVGEYVTTNVGSPGNSVSSAATTNVASMALTAGDWDVWGFVGYTPAASTIMTAVSCGVNSTTATISEAGRFLLSGISLSAASNCEFPTGVQRISLSGAGTAYLVTYQTFTTSTCKAYGYLYARRVR